MKKRIINSIRRELAFWGIDVSAYSDDELEKGFLQGSRAITSWGFTMEEAARAISASE